LDVQSNFLTATSQNPDDLHCAEEAHAWALLLAAKAAIDSVSIDHPIALRYDESSDYVESDTDKIVDPDLVLDPMGQWRYSASLAMVSKDLLDLYLPALGTHTCRSLVVGHLGQSIDARIATLDGDAFFVTGEENRKHLHRMRALSHAVIVGVGTVQADNPRLTTRSVRGDSPARVIIDPSAKVSLDADLLSDRAARTILIHARSECSETLVDGPGFERIFLPATQGRIGINDIVSALANIGFYRLFVEGGGVTVSGFLQANSLQRLQIATAPLLVGEGRPALQLPGALKMRSALRPPHRLYRMGRDILWDFDLRVTSATGAGSDTQSSDTGRRPSLERLL